MSRGEIRDVMRAHRGALLAVFDASCWLWSFGTYALLRLGDSATSLSWSTLLTVWLATCALQTVVGLSLGLYQGRARVGTFEELQLLGLAVVPTGVAVSLVNALWEGTLLPRSVPAAAAFLALALMCFGRALWRWAREQSTRVRADDARPVLVYGAGEAGTQLVKSMLSDDRPGLRPVAFVDDDPYKRNLRIAGIPVLGDGQRLAGLAERLGVDLVILAVPSGTAQTIRRLTALVHGAGLAVKVLPGVAELLDGRVAVSDVRDINVADLLGRHQIEVDLDAVAGYLSGRRVLVTGAGGSIGSELCRQIARHNPAELTMLDRDESALHAVQLSLHGRALLDSPEIALCDLRDSRSLHAVFARHRPQVVFHAAALKHLPLLQNHPGEAVQTNVWGTLAVLDAAQQCGVDRFVNISTDKAADPENILGYSKRLAERLTAAMAGSCAGTYVSVRFGNVLGSRGSVLTAFAAQLARGGPLTVTHPDVTRYFMTVQEAVQLVVQAGAIGDSGEALILDMGEPVSIAELAQRLADESEHPIEIQYTGLRPGEKLHEVLLGYGEGDHRPHHPLVSHVPVPPMNAEHVLALDPWGTPAEQLMAQLAALCTVSLPHQTVNRPSDISRGEVHERIS